MPIDPVTGALIASSVGSLLSGIFGAGSAGKDRKLKEKLAELEASLRRREMLSGETGLANQLRQQSEGLPIRDIALHMMKTRAGMAPGEFRPRDVFNPGMSDGGTAPSQGGYDFSKLQEAASAYTPGAGGTRGDLLEQLLQRIVGQGSPRSNYKPGPKHLRGGYG